MTEEDFQKEIAEIKDYLKIIGKNTKQPVWHSFFKGMLSGLGSVIGIVLAVAAVGWILNVMGIIPGFKNQAVELKTMWQETLDQARKVR